MNLRFPFSNHGVLAIAALTATVLFGRAKSTDALAPYRYPGAGAQLDVKKGDELVLDFHDLPADIHGPSITSSSTFSNTLEPHGQDGGPVVGDEEPAYWMSYTYTVNGSPTKTLGPGESIFGIKAGDVVRIRPDFDGQACLQLQHK